MSEIEHLQKTINKDILKICERIIINISYELYIAEIHLEEVTGGCIAVYLYTY